MVTTPPRRRFAISRKSWKTRRGVCSSSCSATGCTKRSTHGSNRTRKRRSKRSSRSIWRRVTRPRRQPHRIRRRSPERRTMVRSVVAKLRELSRGRDRQERASILLPFLIISIGLGVLAWRSYQLSVRMEHGIDTLAKQYAGYAADITARRVDSAVKGELFRASEEWQQVERHTATPGFDALQRW